MLFLLLFSHKIVSNSLQPHRRKHSRLPCPSPTPKVCSNSCPSNRWCHPTISSSVTPPPAFNLSQHQSLFKWVRSSHQTAKVLQLQHQFFQWIFRLISWINLRMDWFDLLVVQGTLKSLPQHHSSEASVLRCSAFFMIRLSHLTSMTTGKTKASTKWTFIG